VALLALEPLILPHDLLTSQMLPVDDHQVAGFEKGPPQVRIRIPADLPAASVPSLAVSSSPNLRAFDPPPRRPAAP